MLRLTELPNVAHYPEAVVAHWEVHLSIRFGGHGHEQTMSVSLKYINAEDKEAAELMLLAQLQQIGYSARHGTPDA